ncbi:MAG: DNA-directed RNA polymerase subunit B [Candidatus Hodarchaeota archaeon]
MVLSSEDRWSVMKSFFSSKGLVRQHLDSYNDFVERRIKQIVSDVGKIEPDIENYYVRLGRIEIQNPSVREADGSVRNITPSEARIRNLTYSSPIYLEMTPVYQDKKTGMEYDEETTSVYVGRLPIMLKSAFCRLSAMTPEELVEVGEDPNDPGGYFIINGSERVLVTQEDLAPNRILIEEATSSSACTHMAKVFSTARGFRAPVTMERRTDHTYRVSFPSVPGKIPLVVLLRALGLVTDREVVSAITDDPVLAQELIPSFHATEALVVPKDAKATRENALDYIGKRVAVGQTKDYRLRRAEQVLNRYLLPHIGTDSGAALAKAHYVGQMTQRLLELSVDRREQDDKDHYANKRLKLAGDLLTSLFRVAFHNLTRDIKYQLERTATRGRKPNIKTAVRADVITERLRHALATGNWVGGKAGVSQLLDRVNYMSSISHLRRVVSPLSRSQPHFEARDLHPTHFGKICPNETPEGPNCGLVKNLALMSHISVGSDEAEVEEALISLKVQPIDAKSKEEKKNSYIYLNGRFVGTHSQPELLVTRLRDRRQRNELNDQVNLAFYADTNEVQINSDAGRVRRPLIIVKEGVPLLEKQHVERVKSRELTWEDLVKAGIIEYLDAEEEENSLIAMQVEEITPEHTHLEIVPETILGICASLVPFAEHNQSPRNTYEAGMAKQALGLYSANFSLRVDTRSHLLHYVQSPIVTTRPMEVIGYMRRPAGQNFIVAIHSFQGYNIEDALVINKASIERGIARSSFFRCYDAEERKYPGGQEDKFEIPSREVRGYRASEAYRLLSEDGIIEPEFQVGGDEILIGRTSPPRFLEEYTELEVPGPKRRETSVSLRHGEEGTIDKVLISETIDGNRLVKVKVRDERIPELGDKFASRHGQKGVIGLLAPQEDMPFTESGIVPDLVVNAHAFPSRMTLGQILESMAGKIGCLQGKSIDATPFSGRKLEEMIRDLHELGFKYSGRETMYNGVTGHKYDVDLFVGVVYYQKLHHLVADKMHARARGPVQILTRQPTEGRAREGGLRFGEMERDCLIGHGAALLLRERLLEESDKYTAMVCEECGMLAEYDRTRDRYRCRVCSPKTTTISKVEMSYAFKLVLQELISLGIWPRLKLSDRT